MDVSAPNKAQNSLKSGAKMLNALGMFSSLLLLTKKAKEREIEMYPPSC